MEHIWQSLCIVRMTSYGKHLKSPHFQEKLNYGCCYLGDTKNALHSGTNNSTSEMCVECPVFTGTVTPQVPSSTTSLISFGTCVNGDREASRPHLYHKATPTPQDPPSSLLLITSRLQGPAITLPRRFPFIIDWILRESAVLLQGSRSSVVRALTAKVGGLGFDSQWLPMHFFLSWFTISCSCW